MSHNFCHKQSLLNTKNCRLYLTDITIPTMFSFWSSRPRIVLSDLLSMLIQTFCFLVVSRGPYTTRLYPSVESKCRQVQLGMEISNERRWVESEALHPPNEGGPSVQSLAGYRFRGILPQHIYGEGLGAGQELPVRCVG